MKKILLLNEFNADIFGEEDWDEKDAETWEDRYLNRSYYYITFRIKGIKVNKSYLERSGVSLLIKDTQSDEVIGIVHNEESIHEFRMCHPDDVFIFEIQMLIPEDEETEFVDKLNALKTKALNYYRDRMAKDGNKVLKNGYINTLSMDPNNYI